MNKTITLITIILLVSLQAFSQTPNWVWAKDAAVGYSQSNSVATDASGNVYVCGAFYYPTIVFDNDTLVNLNPINYPGDILLVKYDAAGNYLWARSAGGMAADIANAVTVDVFGNVYIAGYFTSDTIHFGSILITNPDSASLVFLAKYDSNGNVIWAKSAGVTGDEAANAIVTDAAGNVYVAGQFQGDSMTIGNTTFINMDTTDNIFLPLSDLFLARYDSSGNVIWVIRAGGTKNDKPTSLIADAAGNLYLSGAFESDSITFGSTLLINNDNSGNTSDIFLVKFDTNSNVIWAKQAGGTGNEFAGTVSIDAANNIYLTGSSASSPSISFGSVTISNYLGRFLAKYDSAGTALWAINAGENADFQEDGNFVTADAFGNVYLSGNFRSNTITFDSITLTNSNNNATNDIFLVKYDSSGNLNWAKMVGGVYDDIAMAITCDVSCDIYLTGYFGSPTAVFAPTTLNNPGMYLAKIDNTTGINEITQNNYGVLTYPDPANTIIIIHENNFQLSYSRNEFPSQLIITDILGNEIYKEIMTGMDKSIDVSRWSDGVYFYQISIPNQPGKETMHGKFVKE